MDPATLLPWILAPTALGAALCGLAALIAARRGTAPATAAGWLATAAAAAAFALSCSVVWRLPAGGLRVSLGTWIAAGPLQVDATLACDPLTAVMLLVVSGVGTLIHLYAIGYMAHDRHRWRFFCYLNAFLTAMLLLVLAGDLLLLFAGWEGVGLCSSLLIGFWHREDRNATAGVKAFVVNRVGDAGVLVGLCALAWAGVAGTGAARLDLAGVAHAFQGAGAAGHPLHATAAIAALLLLLGVAAKSAQIPLSVWLPDAMAGPTPVSALIQAATTVTAGVYLLARCDFLYAAAPVASGVVLVVGATTALVAGVAALGQRDLKRVLAYSTVSQLGFMVAACGAGAPGAAMFHVVTHAFFKATLVLGAGVVIHAAHDEPELAAIDGRARSLMAVKWAMLAACAALAGCPPLAGFVSKESILGAVALGPRVAPGLAQAAFVALAIAAVATAAYAARIWVLCFVPSRGAITDGVHGPDDAEHRPGALQTVPIALLALLAVGGGALAAPAWLPGVAHGWLFDWLHAPVPHPEGDAFAIVLATSLGALVAGAGFGVATARRPPSRWLGVPGLDVVARAVGQGVVDLTRGLLDPFVERGLLGGAVFLVKATVYGLLGLGQLSQGGRVRAYAFVMAAAATGLVAWAVWR